jgi:hypothetical protein
MGLPSGEERVTSVCGKHCNNLFHAFEGSEEEALLFRLEHLFGLPEMQGLSSRALAAIAGCSHITVQRHKRRNTRSNN